MLKRPGGNAFSFPISEAERYDEMMYETALKIGEKMSKRLRLPLEDLTKEELEVRV